VCRCLCQCRRWSRTSSERPGRSPGGNTWPGRRAGAICAHACAGPCRGRPVSAGTAGAHTQEEAGLPRAASTCLYCACTLNLSPNPRAGGGRPAARRVHVPVLPRAVRCGPVCARARVGVRRLRRRRRARSVLPRRARSAGGRRRVRARRVRLCIPRAGDRAAHAGLHSARRARAVADAWACGGASHPACRCCVRPACKRGCALRR